MKTFLYFFENENFHFFCKMKTLKFPSLASHMNPSIVNNRARTVQGSDGKAQPTTSSRVSRPNSVTRPGSPVVPQTTKGELRLLEKSVGAKSAEFREMENNRFSLNFGFGIFCNTERNERVCTPLKQLG